ncbi:MULTISPECIES: type II secretion system F family protein [Prauserella salsuginis group]|uniref:Type II secretion system F family protein n=1 Tax=Prauserella salsuginis TaxID=387889 RepID=A0ABW6FXV7_9PSEU|nr:MULTISPECIES: type II secretion system F family protein [Prauserella salsuginis group]MCR3720893.1 Type II secretion system (T2SS), protein F [Prauserella flava]MCR3735026.1 Type II secretion system (T2SS), protein F [Prauserella salsuginis]
MSPLVPVLLAAALWLPPAVSASRLRSLLPSQATLAKRPRQLRYLVSSERGLPACAGVSAALLVVAAGPVVAAPVVGAGVWWVVTRVRARRGREQPDPLRMAATGDLLAACLRSGMPVSTGVHAVAPTAQSDAAAALHATAGLLALGAEPQQAWLPAKECPATAELARAACRTARSGSALAGVAEDMANREREAVADTAEARAQRAGVLVTGPLGLCFLPAFLCLGIAPVVIGLANELLV